MNVFTVECIYIYMHACIIDVSTNTVVDYVSSAM